MNWQEWTNLAQNEAYWKDHYERGLLKAEHLHDYVLRLWFEEELDVTIYELDFAPLILDDDPGEALLPLRDVGRFSQAVGDYALIWPNPDNGNYDDQAIDLAPECIRFFSEKYGKALKVPQAQ